MESGTSGAAVPKRRQGRSGRRRVSRVAVLCGSLLIGATLVVTSPGAAPAGAAPHKVAPQSTKVSYLAKTPRVLPAAAVTFTVNTTTDTHDATPGDGICADSLGHCSLRAAIEEADALQTVITTVLTDEQTGQALGGGTATGGVRVWNGTVHRAKAGRAVVPGLAPGGAGTIIIEGGKEEGNEGPEK